MVLAVVDRDADVLERESRNRALGKRMADALLDRRDKLVRDRAADDVVDELEPAAARERLDPEVDLAELAGAAGLLLVAVVALGRARDRFPVGDRGRLGLHRHAI